MTQTCKLTILIIADVEVLNCCRPFEVISVANRFTDPAAFRIFTGSKNGRADADPWRPQHQSEGGIQNV